MNTLILTPDRNSAHRAADYTGAFRPEAEAFQAKWGGEIVKVDQSQNAAGRFRQVVQAIHRVEPEVLVDFGHGLPEKLGTLGVTKANAAELAGALTQSGPQGPRVTAPTVILYACLAGGGAGLCGDGSIADVIRDSCVKFGAPGTKVWAHVTSGHTDRNPRTRCFAGPEAKPANIGGQWVVAPGSARWRAWVRYCRGPGRLDFWSLTPDELDARLAKEAA